MNLTIEQRNLLERLYNLKSKDSTIVKEINEKIIENKENSNVLLEESKKLESEKSTFTTKKTELDKQFASFIAEFEGMKSDKYSILLEEANENFDPEKMLSNIKEIIPSRIEEINDNIKKSESDIDVTKKKISETEIDATELECKLTDAIQMQERLAKLIDESLNGNGSITRDSVQELLNSLHFNEDDITELGKMILFPEGTLQAYNDEFTSSMNTGKNITEVIKNAHDASDTEEPTPTEITKVEFADIIKEEKKEEKSEIVVEKETKTTEEIAKQNIEYLKSINIDKEVIKRYETVLTDNTLIDKIKLFIELNKTPQDIELNFDILLAYTLEDLNNLKMICEESDISMSLIPLGLLKQGLGNFFSNYESLISKGIVLDQTELSKNIANLFVEQDVFKNNLGAITKYQISLDKKNGKKAIQCLTQESNELIKGIDALVETGEESIIVDNPERLSTNLVDMSSKIAFCKKNNVPIKSNNGQYYDFVFNDDEFAKIFEGMDTSSMNIQSKEEMEQNLKSIINNSIVEQLSSLNINDHYLNKNNMNENIYFELTDLTKTLNNAELLKYTYKIDNYYFSKERVERNLLHLLNKNVNVESKEIIIAALLYGSIYNREDMQKIMDKINGGVQ